MLGIQLLVSAPAGHVHTYTLTKPDLTIGRFPTNDVVLYDPACSRQHARLHLTAQGFEIEDLGSTNATFLNGMPVKRARVMVGDTISIGDSTLRLQLPQAAEPAGESPQTVSELTRALGDSSVDVEVPDMSQARLVIHTPTRTWEVPLGDGPITLGRDVNCQVVIENRAVSRQHARIVREGRGYLLMDLNSRNGTLHKGERISQHTLVPGDMFQIGEASCIYKGPLDQEAMTLMMDQPIAPVHGTRRPVVFVPGFLGSELWRGNEQIWPNAKALFTNPELYRCTENDCVEAPRLVSDVIIIPNFIKLERHNEPGDFLCEALGYQRTRDYLEFPYDWRLDLRVTAQLLAERIVRWREEVPEARGPITMIGHSLGCLIARYYIERLGGKSLVNRLIMLGGPHLGTPMSLNVFAGFGKQPIHYRLAEPYQRIMATFPSVYSLLPDYPAVFNTQSQPVDLYRDDGWCPEECKPLLRSALAFRQELGNRSSVSAISIFGYGIQTPTRGILEERREGGGWERLRIVQEIRGDDTVPEESGHIPYTEIHPIFQHHGVLYADNDVKMRLKLELMS